MSTRIRLSIAAALVATGCASSPEPVEDVTIDLASHASVTADSAEALAMGYLPGWEIHQSELEPYDGGVWYEFEMVGDDGETDTELRIDANTGRIFEPATVEQEEGQLRAAAIPDARAREIAIRTVGGGRIIKGDIEMEDSVLLYSYEVVREGMGGVTVIDVDATTGNVIGQTHEVR
jgi:uncharacterized membrane protein YkoI